MHQPSKAEIQTLRRERDRMRSALRIIHTWASVAIARNEPDILDPEQTRALCREALGMEEEDHG